VLAIPPLLFVRFREPDWKDEASLEEIDA